MQVSPIVMDGVREYGEGYPVECIIDASTGRVVIRARNEGGNNDTLVDLHDLLEWLRLGPNAGRVGSGFHIPAAPEASL